MVESELPRAQVTNPNPINGREYDTSRGSAVPGQPNDLQYACIFPLPEEIDCSVPARANSCDCVGGADGVDKPLCEPNPGQSAAGNTQYWSKAYPGTRHLQVLKDYGDNSIVASICARNVDDPTASDYGYRPAIAAIVDRLKEQLGDRCLPRGLTVAEDDTVACNLVETTPQPQGECVCDPAFARQRPNEVVDSVVRGQLANDTVSRCAADDPNCTRACLCEVQQVQNVPNNPDGALQVCQQNEQASGVEGWCYVDEEQGIGNPALVEDCPATARRKLRFVGGGLAPNTTTFVFCQGSSLATRE
jgi:hypothetical protein